LAPARKTRQETVSLTLGTHQESSTYVFVFAPGCAVAPNTPGTSTASASPSVPFKDALLPFHKGQTILVGYNSNELGTGVPSNISDIQEDQGYLGIKIVVVDFGLLPTDMQPRDYAAGIISASGITQFDTVVWTQHGDLNGPANGNLAQWFQSTGAAIFSPYLASGGVVVISQCQGVFSAGYLNSIQATFNNAPIYSTPGFPTWALNGLVSNRTLPPNPQTYTPWRKF
jgi:hypothetical protein